MSQENVETARRGYAHFIATGDLLTEILDPEFILDLSTFRDWLGRKEYDGVQGFREFLRDWLEPWDEYEFRCRSCARPATRSWSLGDRRETRTPAVYTWRWKSGT